MGFFWRAAFAKRAAYMNYDYSKVNATEKREGFSE
jgi:hypothetical protein